MKREFKVADELIKDALSLAKWAVLSPSFLLPLSVCYSDLFGEFHPKYVSALQDYGFYLFSSDQTSQAVVVYKVRSTDKSYATDLYLILL